MRSPLWFLLLTLIVTTAPIQAQGDGPPPEVREAVSAVVRMLEGNGEASLAAFARDHLADGYRQSFDGPAALTAHLAAIRSALAGRTGELGVELDPDGLRLIFEGGVEVGLSLVPGTPSIRRLVLLSGAGPEPGIEGTVRSHMQAIEALASAGSAAAAALVEDHFSPELRAQFDPDELTSLLDLVRRSVAGAMTINAGVEDDVHRLSFRGGIALDVRFQVSESAPYLMTAFSATTEVAPDESAEFPPLTWETLDSRLRDLEASGFAGTILALRGADTLLHRAYGMADRAEGRPNDINTVYDIGSAPLDFTRAAVYLLSQRGTLSLDEPIAEIFPDVPADKRAITVGHLLTGRSGLPNFHHIVGVDADHDLSWIDREEAERRILSAPLLFAPGEDGSPSHSAFVLLAAAVERRSGQPYDVFLRENFFDPAGMSRTGSYGESLGLADEAFATGYGASAVGARNIPPEWGPTSWLITGSGGMFSTPGDMHRFFVTIGSGRILQGDALAGYLGRRSVVGGSERGFAYLQAWDQGDATVFLSLNAGQDLPPVRALPRLLIDLVAGG